MLPLLALNGINWRRVGLAAAVGVLLALIAGCLEAFFALRKARLAYENPRVVTVTKTVKVQGPTVIKERIIREPGGREEITREETRGPVVEASDGSHISEPIFAPSARTSGWLLGASVQPFHRWERDGYAAWAGYSFGGRLHLAAGIRGSARAEAMALWRF